MVGSAAASSELFRFRLAVASDRRPGFRDRRAQHQLSDGAVSADGARLHQGSGLGPRLPQSAQAFRSRFGECGPQRNPPRILPRACRGRIGTRSRRDREKIVSARPFFIVSSGRSGTAMMVKALVAAPNATIEHEYMVHLVQPLAV